MGKKGWFSSVKQALSPDSKENRSQNEKKSKKKWFGKEKKSSIPDSPTLESSALSHPLPQPEEENEETKHVYSAAVDADIAADAAPESPAHTPQYITDTIQPTERIEVTDKVKEELAARKIQTAFRGYLARRALRALRGLVRLKSQVEGSIVKRQTTNTLKCMQTLSRVQSQIQSRRIRMTEENQALQKQLLQKRAKELENVQMGDEWDDTAQSKEQIESKLLSKFEAAIRRERAMAYSFSHQQTWKKASRSTNLLFMDPTNPQWGWSWLERWMAGQPREINNNNNNNENSASEITKSYTRHQLNSDKPLASPAKPNNLSPAARKLKLGSPRVEEDSKSVVSGQSERTRRHSLGSASVRDDESMASSPSVPSYMTPTQSAKAKSRLQSPLGFENVNNNVTPDKGSVKKRLSFPGSPARPPRRHSGPPKVETGLAC